MSPPSKGGCQSVEYDFLGEYAAEDADRSASTPGWATTPVRTERDPASLIVCFRFTGRVRPGATGRPRGGHSCRHRHTYVAAIAGATKRWRQE